MKITRLPIPSHEIVLRIEDADIGLLAFIAVHSSLRGPAAGGLRMRPYASEAAALEDALGLSRGMSFKNAAADLPLGGGKAVIIGDPARKSAAQLRGVAAGVESLQGRYWTAEDMGMSPADMAVIREVTPYVAGLDQGDHASGDPSPITARGIFQSIRTAAAQRFGSPVLDGRRVGVQGLGHVGWHLAGLLRAAGAELAVADTDTARAEQAARCLGARVMAPEAITSEPMDIFAPCAVGGILDARTIAALKARVVCGGANTQLATPEDAGHLHRAGILYAPDYIVNAGGIINVATEILRIDDRDAFVTEKLAALDVTLGGILSEAARRGTSPAAVADQIMSARLSRPDAA